MFHNREILANMQTRDDTYLCSANMLVVATLNTLTFPDSKPQANTWSLGWNAIAQGHSWGALKS